jgi:hypothetical protein
MAKVKQSIAVQRILPFYKFLSADRETPKGALFLHWITSVIFVAVAPSSSDGYSFAVGIYTYGHIVFSGTYTPEDEAISELNRASVCCDWSLQTTKAR